MTVRGGLRMCYLAYPIDQRGAAGSEKVVTWATEASRRLWEAGIGVYDPGDAFRLPGGLPVGREVADINRHAAAICDSLLAVIVAGVASVGVPAELERAIAQRKPVGVLTDCTGGSWWMAGYREQQIAVGGLDDADRVIRQMEARAGVGEGRGEIEPLPFRQLDKYDGYLVEPQLPRSAHPGEDAGLDLYVSQTTTCEPGQFTAVPSGYSVELPEWGWGLITGRSSTLQRGLFIKDAVIDSGYRGELFANCWNLGRDPVRVEAGDRIAQLVVMPNLTKDLAPVLRDRLAGSMRGPNGFGSSGK